MARGEEGGTYVGCDIGTSLDSRGGGLVLRACVEVKAKVRARCANEFLVSEAPTGPCWSNLIASDGMRSGVVDSMSRQVAHFGGGEVCKYALDLKVKPCQKCLVLTRDHICCSLRRGLRRRPCHPRVCCGCGPLPTSDRETIMPLDKRSSLGGAGTGRHASRITADVLRLTLPNHQSKRPRIPSFRKPTDCPGQ